MATSLMKKLTLIAPKEEANRLMKKLMWLRCVEVRSEVSDEENALLSKLSCESERSELNRRANVLGAAIAGLSKYNSSKKGFFSGKIEIDKKQFDNVDLSYALDTAEKANRLLSEVQEIRSRINKNEIDITSLSVWENYDVPLEITGTKDTEIRLGVLPLSVGDDALDELQSEASGLYDIEEISRDSAGRYVAVIYHTCVSGRVNRALAANGFSRIEFRDMKGTASEMTRRLEAENKELLSELGKHSERLSALAADIDKLEIAYDSTKSALAAAAAKQKLFCTESTVYMTAWVPEKAQKKLESVLCDLGCWYQFDAPEEGEEPPILLENNAFASPFESVLSMYALPLYGSFDPTMIMSLFYFITFGIMLADVCYGILISLGALLLMKLLKPSKNSSMDKMLRLFAICGASCIVMGVLFGSYFGDLPSVFMQNVLGIANPPKVWSVIDIINDPISLLIVALALGAVQMFVGMGINFYVLCRRGHVFDAIADIGSWYVLYIGIALLFVNSAVGKWVALAGVAMLILTQGRKEKNFIMKIIKGVGSLYNIINFLSDLLSYSRIMALSLSSAVIAMVVNMVGGMGGIVGIVIALLIGHTLNLVLNLLGTYVHTGRLQYIEFFGKFYEDGGRAFDPVIPDTKYTQIIYN